MIMLSRPKAIAAVAVTAAAIAAVSAGCTPQDSIAASRAAGLAATALAQDAHGTGHPHHTPSPTPTPTKPSATPSSSTSAPATSTPTPSSSTSAPATSTPAPPSTTPAPPSTTPAPPSTSPAPPPSATNCTTSGQNGSCGPYAYPQIQGAVQDPVVTNDVWNPISGWKQTLYATNPGNWYTVANEPAGYTGVVSYPDTQALYAEHPLSSFPALYSSFSENMHPQSGTSGEAAYDLWLNNWGNEVMIMHDMHNIGTDPTLATATFGGSNGVPVQNWTLVHNGNELIWQLNGSAEQTGSVDILAMLKWLVSHGYLPQSSNLTAIDYGFEICSTGGANETFQVNSYSVTQ
jgi:hypothetical protein